MKKRALISVSDKTGVEAAAKRLEALGYEIVSTGGTETALKKAGVKTVNISDITGFPECLDGRVKTLHPAVHAGLLAMRSNPEHMAQLERLGVNTIDVVIVNLYPFKQTVMRGCDFAEAVENFGGKELSGRRGFGRSRRLRENAVRAGVGRRIARDQKVSYV